MLLAPGISDWQFLLAFVITFGLLWLFRLI